REVEHGDAVEGHGGVGHAGHLTPAVLGSSRPASEETAMKAVVARMWGEPAMLEYTEVFPPAPRPGQVLIDVKAIGCNFPDILIVQGKYQKKPPLPFSPGAEVAGVVRDVGAGVTQVGIGERVFALMDWGAYAEQVVVDQHHAYALPGFMTFETGAAFGLAYQTAWCGLVRRAALRRGETLLVHGAAGGAGLAAVQLAKALGARVIATAGSREKLEVARAAGADVLVNYRTEEWIERVKKETDGRGADVIYDPVGGDVFDGSTRCIAFEGRLLVIGFTSGRIAEVATNRVLLKNVSIVGVHWGLYSERDPVLVRRWMVELLKLAEAGQLKPVISRTFPLREATRALALSRGGTILNAPGLIDAGYRGELKVLLVNHDAETTVTLRRGERVAQLVVQRVERAEPVPVDELPASERGAGGFGSTGG